MAKRARLSHTQRCALLVLWDAGNEGLTTLAIDRAVRERSGNTVSPNQATVARLQKLGLIEWGRPFWQLTAAGTLAAAAAMVRGHTRSGREASNG